MAAVPIANVDSVNRGSLAKLPQINKINKWIILSGIFALLGVVAIVLGAYGLHHVFIDLATSDLLIGGGVCSLALSSLGLIKGIRNKKYNAPQVNPKDFGLSGIQNTNNNCWLNSLMQMLLNSPLRENLANNRNFRSFCRDYNSSVNGVNDAPDSAPLRAYLSGQVQDIGAGGFQDLDEPLNVILSELRGRVPNLRNTLITRNHFRNDDGREYVSETVNRENNNGALSLPIETGYASVNLSNLLQNFFRSPQDVEANRIERIVNTIPGKAVPYTWGLLRWGDRIETENVILENRRLILEERSLQRAPQDLFLTIKRQCYSRGAVMMVNRNVNAPAELNMPNEYFSDNSGARYSLTSFANFVHEVHYISYVKRGDVWFKCNDSNVEAISEAAALNAAKLAYVVHYSKNN